MDHERDAALASSDLSDIVRKVRTRTPARLLVGRAGASYRTNTQMELREAHAGARDAVRAELNLQEVFGNEFVERWKLFDARTRARSKDEYLLRPDLGRRFDDESRAEIQKRCMRSSDLQIVIGDGLSVPAVAKQVPPLLPLLFEGAKERGWSVGQPFVIRYCRVGILNEIGQLLDAGVVALLIGERPGLATAESLSAYLAYRPCNTHTDANRNVISNIHSRGLNPEEAVARLLQVAERMMEARASGCLLDSGMAEVGERNRSSLRRLHSD
jgi:ethanolamine ammonia-lyase small subunit